MPVTCAPKGGLDQGGASLPTLPGGAAHSGSRENQLLSCKGFSERRVSEGERPKKTKGCARCDVRCFKESNLGTLLGTQNRRRETAVKISHVNENPGRGGG